jgi:drug/metabolite transporter (DMT)-like permease
MTKTREGEWLMLAISVLEGLFPVLSLFSIALIGALYTYGFVLLFATILLFLIVIQKRLTHQLFYRPAQKDLLLTTLYIGLLFTLIFLSLRYTSASNVAVILFLQLLFSYLYFNVFGKERMTRLHSIGALLMGLGAVVVLLPDRLQVNGGDGLALLAAAIAPVANVYQKRAREYVSTITILTYRNLLALPFIFIAAYTVEAPFTQADLMAALPYVIGIALLVYVLAKIFWIEALHRISITKMSAMLALIPLFTMFFAFLLLDEIPSLRQMVGIAPILLGGYLLTRAK